ncbi:hypothetical protein, partial [Geminicoccus harenae]|uniref:hypothetical protein n=1 Tax=Geminicoccus harenae TaxID=2498453 RepID=UPI001C97F51E
MERQKKKGGHSFLSRTGDIAKLTKYYNNKIKIYLSLYTCCENAPAIQAFLKGKLLASYKRELALLNKNSRKKGFRPKGKKKKIKAE